MSNDSASAYDHTSGHYHSETIDHATNPYAPAHAHHSDYNEPSYPASHYASLSESPSYSQSDPVDIYPVGCGQVDVSGCGYSAYASPSDHETPALRGRAKKSVYASIGAGTVDLDRELYAGVIRLGVDGEYLGLEVEGSKGFKSDNSLPVANTEQSLGLDYSVAGFGVVRVPLGERFRALGRFGYHFSQLDQTLTRRRQFHVRKSKI